MPETDRTSIGAVGRQVVANVKELMAARGLSQRDLSARLAGTGRRILPSPLQRLTSGARRVDADDLLALAIALQVTPNALLFPRHIRADDIIELAPEVRQRAALVWAWADGRMPLPPALGAEGVNVHVTPGEVFADYVRHSRPDAAHDQDPFITELLTLRQMIEDVLGDQDPVARWAQWRDTILRRWRIVGVQLEELVSRLDREAMTRSAFEFDTGTAVEQLRVTTEQVRRPVIGYAPGAALSGEGTMTAGSPHAAPTSTNESRGAATTIPYRPPTTDER